MKNFLPFSHVIRAFKIGTYSRVVGSTDIATAGNLFSNAAKKEDALNKLVATVYQDKDIQKTLTYFGANCDDLKKLYECLITGGAGQWVKGHFVAASCTNNPIVLYAYLKGKNTEDYKNFCLELSFTCIEYISRNSDYKYLMSKLNVPSKI